MAKIKGKKTSEHPKKLTKSYRIAAIDLGSTSIRMRIAEIDTDSRIQQIDDLVFPVAIGNDTFITNRIGAKTLGSICKIMRNFATIAKEYKVDETLAVATSSVREADNADIILDRIEHASGIKVTILDPVDESRLTCQLLLPFIANNLKKCRKNILFFDIGGGSTETLLIKNGDILLANNRRFGTSRLYQRLRGKSTKDRHMLLESLIRNAIASTFSHFLGYSIGECVITNALLIKLFSQGKRSTQVIGGIEVSIDSFNRVAKDCAQLREEEISKRYLLSLDEVEQLVPALLILQRLFRTIKINRFFIAEFRMLRAISHDMRLKMLGKSPLLEFSSQIVKGAKGVGKKFRYDAKHASSVARISVQLYDYLQELLVLSGKDRLYLEVAAVLHDIGKFIRDEAHHKHTQYLINNSELVGFNRDERELVGLIARFHRKALPSQKNKDFSKLPLESRLRVIKLTAILRLADALDRPHRDLIKNLSIAIANEKITINLKGGTDMIIERMAIQEKGEYLKEITGLDIEILC